MGSITTGIGLFSGIDSATLINQLLALESRPRIQFQQRVADLQNQKTALLDINARLLSLLNSSRRIRTDNVFRGVKATPSDASALSATATSQTPPGTYSFLVKNLVSTSQWMSRGFASRSESPLGLESLSFDLGGGSRLDRDESLDNLNGGNGVRRGRIVITDRAGASATVDLTDVMSVQEVVDRINGSDSVGVTARFGAQGLILEDTSGGAGSLSVQNATGSQTATDLGIAGSSAGGTITGASIWYLGTGTSLATLGDGSGATVRNSVSDLRITARNGTVFDLDFGRKDLPIESSTLLSALNSGSGIRFDNDPDTADIRFVARDGTEHAVNLSGLTTVGGLITRVAQETGGAITLSVTSGDRFTVTDTTGGSGLLRVLGSETNGTKAAVDLGILNEAGANAPSFTGDVVPAQIEQAAATTLGEIIDRIAQQTSGTIIARISADGRRLELEDTSGGGGNLIVRRTAANEFLAGQLGIETDPAGIASSVHSGTRRILSGIGGALMDSLQGGRGLGGADGLSLTDRLGNSVVITGLDAAETVEELITLVNAQAGAAGVAVALGLNTVRNGLRLTDTSGGTGTLIAAGDAAAALGISAQVEGDSIEGSNLELRSVSVATAISSLNYGRGIGSGTIRLRDGLGRTAEVIINGTEKTVFDIVQKMNAAGGGILAIRARVNDTGDGIVLEQDDDRLDGQTPTVALRVEAVSGTAARDLNLLGTATGPGASINGSYERKIDVSSADSLDTIVQKIRDSGAPVNVTVLSTGGGPTPFRLNITSAITGGRGDLTIDTGGVDLGLNRVVEGRDARVFFGSADPESGFLLTTSDNVLRGVVDGLTVTLAKAGDAPVTVTVSKDMDGIVDSVRQMVTTFNDVIGRVSEYDSYDTDSKRRGPLLGSAATATIRASLYGIVNGRALNVEGSYQYLSQIGVRIARDGQLSFDESKFRAALESDPAAVERVLSAYEVTANPAQEVADGVTINASGTTWRSLGFAPLLERFASDVTTTAGGTITRADQAYQRQIDAMRSRITAFDERIERRRERLQAQFIALEKSLAQLQSQGSALASIQNLSSLTVGR